MIDAFLRVITDEIELPVGAVILAGWGCLALGLAIGFDPRPKARKRKPQPQPVDTEPKTDEFEAVQAETEELVVEESGAETYGRHAPPTRPVEMAPPQDVVVRVLGQEFPGPVVSTVTRKNPFGHYPRPELTSTIDVQS